MAALSGLLLGLGIDTRLYVLAVGPLFLLWVFPNRRTALSFASGLVVAMIPNLYLLAAAPESYVFENIGYHAIRDDAGLIGNFRQKFEILSQLPAGSEFIGLLILSAVLILLFGVRANAAIRALATSAVLILTCLLPTPTFTQYFCIAVPFLIVAGVYAATIALARLATLDRRRVTALYAALFVACVVCSKAQYAQYLEGTPGINLVNWKWETAAAVSEAINEVAPDREPVLTSWPGYIAGSKAEPFSGTENHFGVAASARLSPAQLSRFHIISEKQIEEAIASHAVRIVAVGDELAPPGITPNPPYRKLLTTAGYREIRNFGDTSIWKAQRPRALSRRLVTGEPAESPM
jgi:hypothetical protein